MLTAQQSKANEQTSEEPQRHRHNRSPSSDSTRLNQQSGGFAQSQVRRNSFSKDNGYYHQNNGYRRQGYNYQRGRNYQRNYQNQNQHNQDYQQNGNTGKNYGHGGYQHNLQHNQHNPHTRSYQNYNSNHQKHQPFYFPNMFPGQQAQQRAMFNSGNELGIYSVRRPSPSSPPSPASASTTSSLMPQNLQRRGEGIEKTFEDHDGQKIHLYRAAGTAPSYSNSSSPLKHPVPPQPPSTPASDKRVSMSEEWQNHHCVPVVQHLQTLQSFNQQHRRAQHDHPAPIELQHKTPIPSIPQEISTASLPATPSAMMDRSQFRAPSKDSPIARSVDSVDEKHSVFADSRWNSALHGVSPQVKNHLQPTGPPIVNEREAGLTIDMLHKMQLQQQIQQHQQHLVRSFIPIYPSQLQPIQLDPSNRHMLKTFNLSSSRHEKEYIEKPRTRRDSSIGSLTSSRGVEHESMKAILDGLDDEVTGGDLDRTPVDLTDDGPVTLKSLEKKQKKEKEKEDELPRKSTRRDSECSSISSAASSSPALDESTLTKILPTEDFHPGRGVASPSPPAALLSEPLSRMDVLSEKIWDYHNKVAQTDEMLQRKLHLRDMLYMAISPVFPMSGLYVVGSSLNGFGNNSSDMDLCLMITNKDLDQKNDAVVVLNLILSTLQYEKFVASQKLILAKVPILRIKFAAPFDDITVDLNANNSVAIRNTHLLCYYSSYDWRVRPLVSVVKEWAKRKGINDANKSSFTSYSLVLMVIHYLQCGAASKVLPNLQQSYSSRFSNKVDVRTLNVTMPLDPITDSQEDLSSSEKTTLGELLIGFLDYYANKFDYDRDAISIRQGQRVERATLAARPKMHLNSGGDKETPPPSSSASSSSLHNGVNSLLATMPLSMANPHFWRSQWRCVCIEEPFTNSNTAHSIYDEMVFGAIKEAFREAHAELEHNHDLDRLMECEPIKASTTNAGAAVFAATYEGERPMAQQPTTIATANLRAMSHLPTGAVPFHFQQPHTATQQPQVLKQQQQRSGGNQGYQQQQQQMFQNNHRNNSNRRPYGQQHQQHQQQQQQQQSNGSSARSSKSMENQRQQQQQQRNGQGAKENVNTNTMTSPGSEKKQNLQNQQQQRKDDGSKPKHQRPLQSPDPSSKQQQKVRSPTVSTSTAV